MGKNLTQKLLLLLTSVLIGCPPPINEDFFPKALLNAYQQGTSSNIIAQLNGNDPDGKQITKYRVGRDKNGDNVLENTEVEIESNVPIVNGLIYAGSYGTFNVLGETVSSNGKTGRTSLEVTLNEPPKPVFSGSLSVSLPSGNVLLEDLVSFIGSSTGGTVTKYEIGADLDNDGKLEDNEIITSSTSEIKDYKVIFTKPGIYQMYGRATDAEGNTGMSGPIPVTISATIANSGLEGKMTFDTYSVGNNPFFTFDGQIKNNDTSDKTIDISQKDNLVYRLIREIIPGIGEEVLNQKFQNNLQIILSPSGYFGIKQMKKGDTFNGSPLENDSLIFTISPENATIWQDGKDVTPYYRIYHILSPDGYPISSSCYKFVKTGNYSVATSIRDNNFNYLSSPFAAN